MLAGGAHQHQIVRRVREGEDPSHVCWSSIVEFSGQDNVLSQSARFFDEPPLHLPNRAARMAHGSIIHGNVRLGRMDVP